MATKIKSYTFYVAITPYEVEGVEDEYNELSVLADYNQYTHVFYVSLHPGWRSSFGHGCMILGDRNPLTASTLVCVKESPKNSQKFINEMGGALELAKDDIAWLFNERKWDELKRLVKDVAICGYTPGIEQRMKDLRNPQNPNNKNSSSNKTEETMAENVKAADLIGKTIVNGNMKYVVTEAIDDEKIKVEFTSGDRAPVAMPMRVEQVDKLLAGGWKFADGTTATETKASDDVEEVEDIKPEKPKGKTVKMDEPKAKTEKPQGKAKGGKSQGPDSSQAANQKSQSQRFTYSTYQNKKGKTCAKIAGFKEDDAVYQKETATALHGSPMGGSLLFGKAYVAFAKQLCDALNEGKSIDECKAMLAKYDEKRAADKAQAKAEREEHKAEKPEGKVYTEQEVVDLVERIIAGDKAAMDELNAMRKAA